MVEQKGEGGETMAKITTTELVKKIYKFCEAYSGVELFPYQQQFAYRIIRSVLENDGEEITALFSRQCVSKGSLVHMADGTKKPIENIEAGDDVLAFDYDEFVPRKVIDSYNTGVREVYRLRLKSGQEIYCTANHRFLDKGSRLFKPLYEFEAGNEIGYVDEKTGRIRFSRIKSIMFMGEQETYDIEVESAENFLCNEILTHNSGKSETVSTICGGLAIILPTLANLPMFVTDNRLNRFKDGIMIGIFAPTLRQAQVCFNRMKKRMGSRHATEILSDPEINVTFDVSNGQNVVLSNGSLISSQSASEGSNIEGDSYMLIIVDESQDVGNFKYSKCLSEDTEVWLPDGSKATIKDVVENKMNVVTLDGSKTPDEFYNNGIQPVYELTLSNGRKIEATENHQFYVRRRIGNRVPKWDTVSNIEVGDTLAVPKEVPYFGDKYNQRQGQLVGFMLGDGCMTGDSPMICVNKKVRDYIIPYLLRDFENTEYKEITYNEQKDLSEGYFKRISREGNKEGELKLFLKELGIWGLKGSEKTITPQIFNASKSFLKGLVIGLIESDGSVSNNEIVFSNTSESLVRGFQDILLKFGVPSRVSVREQNGDFGKNPKPIWSCTIKSKEGILKFFGEFELFTKQKKLIQLVRKIEAKNGNRKIVNDLRRGKFRDDIYFERVVSKKLIGEKPTYCLKVEGRNFIANGIVSSNSISPMGAFYNATKILIGTATTHRGFFFDAIERNKKDYENGGKRNHFQYNYEVVMKYNPNYEKYIIGEKKRIGENSDEFQMSYNLKWILERGMFVDSKLFDELGCPEMGLSIMDTQKVHVAGIDLGKRSDSTVVTVLEVDWDNPIVVEKAQMGDMDVPDYIAYNVYVKAWLDIQGDNWNEQYEQIKDFLGNFNIARIVMDATGVGDAIYDRLRANLDCEIVPFVFSKQGKSDLYKHLNTEFRAKRVHYPANPETKETIEFKKFQQEFLDLQKTYSGQLMVVTHPQVAGAHDDYPDSLALAVWASKGEPVAKPVTENQRLFEKKSTGFTRARNTLTARRR